MTASRKPSGARPLSIEDLAAEIYDECGSDSNAAVEKLYNRTRNIASYVDKGYMMACQQWIGNVMSRDRSVAISGGNISVVVPPEPANQDYPGATMRHEDMPSFQSEAAKKASGERLLSVLTGIFATPFKFDGKDIFLGSATAEELAPVRDRYLANGRTQLVRGRWLEKVIAAAKPGVPIHQCLKAKDVERMKADAEKIAV